MNYKHLYLTIAISLINSLIYSQQKPPDTVAGIPVNYNEAKVGTYTLPDPLTMNDGKKVTSADEWMKKRRPEIFKMYQEIQFGKAPDKAANMHFDVFDKGTPVFSGSAIRKQVTVFFTKDTSDHKMDLLIYLPVAAQKPVPLLLNVSFVPNCLSVDDPAIKKGYMWTRDGK